MLLFFHLFARVINITTSNEIAMLLERYRRKWLMGRQLAGMPNYLRLLFPY
jgi:hypothetical protein